MAGWTSTNDYIFPYITHMKQKQTTAAAKQLCTYQKARKRSVGDSWQLDDEDNVEWLIVDWHVVMNTVLGTSDQVLIDIATVALNNQDFVSVGFIIEENPAT